MDGLGWGLYILLQTDGCCGLFISYAEWLVEQHKHIIDMLKGAGF
jgi:hypothetical protein